MATLDVRPMMARGEEPFMAIMEAVGGLSPDEDFELLAPLDPVPLYQVLGSQGFAHETEALGAGDYRVIFRRANARERTPAIWDGTLTFTVGARWSGSAREGSGVLRSGGQSVTYSVPASMRGRGEGMSPEELLASAVVSCYSATLAGLLAQAKLPVARIDIHASEVVADYPGPKARVASITVTPVFVGADDGRRDDYVAAARQARERCFIGRQLAVDVDYRVGQAGFATETEDHGVLDVRSFPPPRRHQLIFDALDELKEGGSVVLINDHDPKPLYHQLDATRPGAFSREYLEEGPEAWRVRIVRR